MEKIIFEDLPSTKTPINATNLNLVQDNVENAINDKPNVLNVKSTSTQDTYSCDYINNELNPINDSVNEFLNMGLLTAKHAPTSSSVASIDKTKFGIYSISAGTDTPTTGHGNDNYIIINLPSVHGVGYSIQVAFSIWVGQSGIGGTKIYWKAGSQTTWQSTN